MTDTRMLNAYRDKQLVGTLFDEHPLRFTYAQSWLKQAQATPIAPNISLDNQEHIGEQVEAYFENLLPEANLRELLKIKYQTTTVFGLLSAVGGDTASALILLRPGELPQPPEYRVTTWEAIAASLQNLSLPAENAQQDEGARISLAGAQHKKGILMMPNGIPALPLGNSPSSHILKPNIGGMEGVWASALNETFVMKLASALEIGVAVVEYQPIVKACLIKRYDRTPNQSGELIRLHQLDLCQLDGKPSVIKYESDGGPSLARCRYLLQANNVPAMDLKRLIEWVFFNLFIGNNDSHAKNLSVYYEPEQGVRLAPFYDMLSTSLYSGLSTKFAFRIGGENIPGNIRVGHLHAMAKDLGFKPKYVLKIAGIVAENLLNNVDQVAQNLAQVASPGTEETLLVRLSRHIISNTKKLQARWELNI